jgi:hypothetical protein
MSRQSDISKCFTYGRDLVLQNQHPEYYTEAERTRLLNSILYEADEEMLGFVLMGKEWAEQMIWEVEL